jgi:all-trans-retinol dehydrogenase (NAD+)
MKNLEGKTVLITGGAMGMGRALAHLFLKDKTRVILVDIKREELEKTASELRRLGEVHPYVCDISDREKVYELAEKVHKEVGKIDILVNNAGIVFGGRFLDVPDDHHKKTMDVNIMGMMWMTKAFLPDLLEKKEGHIINLSSAAGLMGVPELTSYCASKHAVIGFTESLQFELMRNGIKDIRFTIICPSYVATGMFEGVKPPRLTRWLTPDEMAKKIYKAMKKNRSMLIVPRLARISVLSKLISATRVYRLQKALKVDVSMEGWKGRG